jgi:integrase/recombinase XerD
MQMRKLKPKTQPAYIRAVRKFAKFLGRSPDTAIDEDLRRFQRQPIDAGALPITLNATIGGLNHLFEISCGHWPVNTYSESIRVARITKWQLEKNIDTGADTK